MQACQHSSSSRDAVHSALHGSRTHSAAHLEQQHDVVLGRHRQQPKLQVLVKPVKVRRRPLRQRVGADLQPPRVHAGRQLAPLL